MQPWEWYLQSTFLLLLNQRLHGTVAERRSLAGKLSGPTLDLQLMYDHYYR